MQADRQSDSSPPQSAAPADGQEANVMDTSPYTLKFSNHLGDVRLQSKGPSVESEQVLYFTAQWKQDGGGVYDVTKLTNPEVSLCCISELLHTHCALSRNVQTLGSTLFWFQLDA